MENTITEQDIKLYKREEVAKLLRISVRALDDLKAKGKIGFVKNTKFIMFTLDQIKKYIENQSKEPEEWR